MALFRLIWLAPKGHDPQKGAPDVVLIRCRQRYQVDKALETPNQNNVRCFLWWAQVIGRVPLSNLGLYFLTPKVPSEVVIISDNYCMCITVWGASLWRYFVKWFFRVPQAVGLSCSCRAAQASKENIQKTFNKTFFATCRPRLLA